MGGWNGDRKLRKTWKISIFRKNAISGKSFLGPINEFLNFFFGKRQNTSWSCSQYSKFAKFRRKSIKIFDPNYGKIRKMQKILLQKFCKNALNLRPLGDFWGVTIWPVPYDRQKIIDIYEKAWNFKFHNTSNSCRSMQIQSTSQNKFILTV